MTDLITAEEAKKLLDGTTPGPWDWDTGDGTIYMADGDVSPRIATIDWDNTDADQGYADAELIAAAPDLARTVIALHAQLADAKAAQAMVVERAVGVAKRHRSKVQINEPLWHDGQDWASDRIAEAIEALADTDGMALVQALRAERDEAKRLMEMRHREMLAADELMRKHQRRAEKAEAERERLAAANAVLEARVAELEGALRNLVGPDCMYDGRNIVITAVSHGDAIRLVADARAALATQEAGPEQTSGWQPIETAPKDGLIDIWLSEGQRWCDCYYDRICDEWRTSRPSGKLVWIKAKHVTHWRPRTPAPAALATQEAGNG